MLEDTNIRKIGLVDETVYESENGERYIKVYPVDKGEPKNVVLTKESLRDYRHLLTAYPTLMKHAKKGRAKIWTMKF